MDEIPSKKLLSPAIDGGIPVANEEVARESRSGRVRDVRSNDWNAGVPWMALQANYPRDRPSLSNLAGKKFLLGVGAQKCGTSWLHNYLASHPDVQLPAIKELHYFDQLFRPELAPKGVRKFEGTLDQVLAATVGRTLTESDAALLRCLVDRVKMNYDPGMYLDFFNRLAASGRPVIGEITPTYGLLHADAFKKIRATLVRYDLEPRVLFLMRDPAQRFWSQVRFELQEGRQLSKKRDLDAAFQAALVNRNILGQSRYDLTIAALKSSFASEELYFGFYENLFSETGIRSICKFLGARPDHPADPGVVNASPAAELEPEKLTLLRKTFAQVYRFCESEFGAGLPPAWRNL